MEKAVFACFPHPLLFPIVFGGKFGIFSLKAVTCFKVKHINYLSIFKN